MTSRNNQATRAQTRENGRISHVRNKSATPASARPCETIQPTQYPHALAPIWSVQCINSSSSGSSGSSINTSSIDTQKRLQESVARKVMHNRSVNVLRRTALPLVVPRIHATYCHASTKHFAVPISGAKSSGASWPHFRYTLYSKALSGQHGQRGLPSRNVFSFCSHRNKTSSPTSNSLERSRTHVVR